MPDFNRVSFLVIASAAFTVICTFLPQKINEQSGQPPTASHTEKRGREEERASER